MPTAVAAGLHFAFFGITINDLLALYRQVDPICFWGLDTLVPCKLSLIEPIDTTIQAEASPVCRAVHQQERNLLHVLLYRFPKQIFQEAII